LEQEIVVHVGLVTDSLAELSLDALIEVAADFGIAALGFGCGNWSSPRTWIRTRCWPMTADAGFVSLLALRRASLGFLPRH